MAALPRPYWTGFLKLSLVTIGVRLYAAATEKERVHFHMIHEPSAERVHQQLVVPGLGPVERAEIAKGYEYERGHYVTIAPDDLQRLRLETTDTIDIKDFVDGDGLAEVYIADPYYLVPDGSMAEQGYRVLHEALRDTGKIAVGQVVINTRERAVAVRPYENGLLLNTLRFADEVLAAEPFFAGIPEGAADPDELALMRQVIARRVRLFDPTEFVDHYQQALRRVINEKLAGKLPEKPAAEQPTAQVINLMDALKRSLAAEPPRGEPAGSRRRERQPRTAAGGRKSPNSRRSLLLPVKGGRGESAAATEEAPAPRRRKKA